MYVATSLGSRQIYIVSVNLAILFNLKRMYCIYLCSFVTSPGKA